MNELKKQQLFRFSVDLFIDLLEQTTKRKKIPYRCNNADTSAWNNFVHIYGASIGEDFIRKFIEFGIQSWFNDGSNRDYSHSVRFSWIIGKESIRRYNLLSRDACDWVVRKGLKTNHKIDTNHCRVDLSCCLQLRETEETFKNEFHNTMRGAAWCIANTTLYYHKSSNCATCIFKTQCKDTLKTEYPKIYILRGYGKEK